MNDKTVMTCIDERGVATVTLNRPHKHNAFDDRVIGELTQAFTTLGQNDNVRIVVLASIGKNFSAGADLAWMQRMANYSYEENLRDANALAEMLKVLNFLPKPTIAKVQGAVFGGAVGLISCCDMAVAGERAFFCLSEVKIGLIPATIGPYVVAAIGQRAARRYFATAECFDATRAAQLNLVSTVVEENELDSVIDRWIAELLANSPHAIKAAKQLVQDITYENITETLIQDTSKRIASIRVSSDGQRRLKAFLEKKRS